MSYIDLPPIAKRFRPNNFLPAIMEETEDGDWVSYEDYVLIREALQGANDELMEMGEHEE